MSLWGGDYLPLHRIHQRFEFIDVFKTAVHAGEVDVDDLVELFCSHITSSRKRAVGTVLAKVGVCHER